jgi:hypothetical protein
MDQVSGFLSNALTWRFLNEPFYRWFLFIIILTAALGLWSSALRHMQSGD